MAVLRFNHDHSPTSIVKDGSFGEYINKKFRESDILLDEDNLTNNINNFKKLYNTLDIQDKNEKDINVSKDEFEIVE